MQRDFKFPSPVAGKAPTPPYGANGPGVSQDNGMEVATVIAPSVDIPPPLPTPKEKGPPTFSPVTDGEDEVGETVEVDLS